ncbi:unnamed protein product [Calypogeia fissa]
MPDACFVCRRRGHQARHCPSKKGTSHIPPPPIAAKTPEIGASIAQPTTAQHPPGSTTKVQKEHITSNPPTSHRGLLDGFIVIPTHLKGGTTQGGEGLDQDPSTLILNQNPFALLDDDGEGAGEDEITILIATPPTQVILSKGTDNTQIPIIAPIQHQSASHSAPVAADSIEVTAIVTPIRQKVHREELNSRGDTLNATEAPNLAQHNSAKNIRKDLATPIGIFTSPISVEGKNDPKSTSGPKWAEPDGGDVPMKDVSSETLLKQGNDRSPPLDVQDDFLLPPEPDEMEGVGSNVLMADVGESLSQALASQSTGSVQECLVIPDVENTTFLNRTDVSNTIHPNLLTEFKSRIPCVPLLNVERRKLVCRSTRGAGQLGLPRPSTPARKGGGRGVTMSERVRGFRALPPSPRLFSAPRHDLFVSFALPIHFLHLLIAIVPGVHPCADFRADAASGLDLLSITCVALEWGEGDAPIHGRAHGFRSVAERQ